jgi:hypothetical protein
MVALGAAVPLGVLSARQAQFLAAIEAPVVITPRRSLLVCDLTESVADTALRVLAPLRLPIAAIYTSGGKSIHALVRVCADSKADWDHIRNELSPLMTAVGADGAALSAVRLTRLPFTLRMGSEKRDGTYVEWKTPGRQELLWLDPDPDGRGMIRKARIRGD